MPPRDPSEIQALLSRDGVLGTLPAPALQALAQAARVEQHDSAALLNAAGQALGRLRLVISGHVEIIARRPSGEEVALGDIGAGGWATWVACLSPEPPLHDFYSVPGACYVAVPTRLVREVCAAHPAIYPRIVADLGVRMRQLMEWAGDSVMLGPEQRMAKLIHLMARTHGIVDGGGTLQITQSRLARMARCSRQSANTLLGALEQRGLIATAYGKFEVRDMKALQAFIDAEPPAP